MSTFALSCELRPQLVVCGPSWVDYQLQLDSAPQAEHPTRIVGEDRAVSGRGALTSALLAGWGASVILVTPDLGEDSNGRFARRELAGIPNLIVNSSEISVQETPYRVILAPPTGLASELWRGKTSPIASMDAILATTVSSWVLDDETVPESLFNDRMSGLGAPRFACVTSPQSTLAQGVELVWLRRTQVPDSDLLMAAANLSTTVVVLEGDSLRLSVCGASVQSLPLVKSMDAGKGLACVAQYVWSALIWGFVHRWELEDSLVFAQSVALAKSMSGVARPSLEAISEAARGMVK